MTSPEKKELLRKHLREILKRSFPCYRSKEELEKAFEKYNLLDSTERKQRDKRQRSLESIQKELHIGANQ